MFKEYTQNYYANKKLHAYRYGYAESFEKYAPDVKLNSMIILAVSASIIGAFAGGLFCAIITGVLTAAFMHHCYVDIAAAFVPNPLEEKAVKDDAVFNFLRGAGQVLTTEKFQIQSCARVGKALGKEAAEQHHREVSASAPRYR